MGVSFSQAQDAPLVAEPAYDGGQIEQINTADILFVQLVGVGGLAEVTLGELSSSTDLPLPTIHRLLRYAEEDYELRGRRIAKGDGLMMSGRNPSATTPASGHT